MCVCVWGGGGGQKAGEGIQITPFKINKSGSLERSSGISAYEQAASVGFVLLCFLTLTLVIYYT